MPSCVTIDMKLSPPVAHVPHTGTALPRSRTLNSTYRAVPMDELDIPCYVARCKCGCGAITFASVDEPEQSQERRNDTAKEIADLVRDGFTIERMPVGEVRSANWKCTSKTAGPQIVCAGCGGPTGIYAPLCDECGRNYVELAAELPTCLFCDQGRPRDATGLLHRTASGGYMGKCDNPKPTSTTSNSCASEKT